MKLTIAAGLHRRAGTPVEVALSESLPEGAVRLVGPAGARWGQVIHAGGPKLVFIPDELKPGAEVSYEVEAADGAPEAVKVSAGGGRVRIDVDGELFTAYNYEGVPRPFLYPVAGPYGSAPTRHFPMQELEGERKDHPHHRSIWFTHGDVNGVDNWSEMKNHGRTVHQRFERLVGGPVFGELVSHNQWVSNSGQPVIDETTTLRVYRLPEGERIIDAALQFTARHGEVKFGDTKEGGLVAVRVATSMDGDKNGIIVNGAGGVAEAETWGKRAPWCDYSGPVDTEWGRRWIGISLFDHPANPRFPTWWHVRNYGLMTANCFGLSHYTNDKLQDGSLVLPAGESIGWRYRIYLHRGDHAAGRVEERYADWAYAPKVTIA